MSAKRLYYLLKPLIPRSAQISLRRAVIKRQRAKYNSEWPILPSSAKLPTNWLGWPENKRFAVVLTHDVETAIGQDRCKSLQNIEQERGFVSSYNFVPERYPDRPELRSFLTNKGYEVGVHGLNHDGKLYASLQEFKQRAKHINAYLKQWNARGFRSPAMHHNLNWLRSLEIEYDASTFDTDPFEPQPDGVGTIFPFLVPPDAGHPGYVELPYTLAQDFTLFVLMEERTIDIWKNKVDWIVEKGGMVLVNTHPDYMAFDDNSANLEEYPVHYYADLLNYIREKYEGQYWHALPRDVADFWKHRQAQLSSPNEVSG